MTIKGTIVSIAMVITLMVFAASQSKAQVEPILPLPVLPAPPEVDEQELPPAPPQMYRVNRNVPCADFNYVKSLLAARGQQPIAQGRSLDPSELMTQFVLTYNETDGTFNIIVVDANNKIACNLYSGAGFMPIMAVN